MTQCKQAPLKLNIY